MNPQERGETSRPKCRLVPFEGVAPTSFVALGRQGAKRKSDFIGDVWALFERLPEPPPSQEERPLLLLAADRYLFALALWAGWLKGHCFLLPPNGQPGTLSKLAEESHTQLVLHEGNFTQGLNLLEFVDQKPSGSETAKNELSLCVGEEQPLLWVCTSGSSGEPKRIKKTAGQLFGEARMLAEFLNLGPQDCVVASVPSHHIYGLLFGILTPLLAGATFVRDSPLHPGEIRAAISKTEATVLVSVPAHLQGLHSEGWSKDQASTLKYVLSSGAPLDPTLGSSVAALLTREESRLCEIFGSTETGGVAWRTHLSTGPQGSEQPIVSENLRWRPLPGVEVCTAKTEDPEVTTRMEIRSPFVQALAKDGTPKPYLTDDRIELADDGSFRHLGRADRVVKVAGKRIDLDEIAARLCSVSGVKDAVAISEATAGIRAQMIRAFVVAPGHHEEGLKAQLRQWIDPVALPRRIVFLDELPRNERGKVDIERLEKRAGKLSRPTQIELGDWVAVSSNGDRSSESNREEFETSFRVPESLRMMEGHFPSFPVLPGALQVDLIHREALKKWSNLGGLKRILQLKFKAPIGPGVRGRVKLRRELNSPKVHFEFRIGEGRVASQGVLEFAAV